MDSAENDLSGTKVTNNVWSGFLKALLAVLRVMGPPIVALVLALTVIAVTKAVRRYRRRTAGTASKRVAAAWRDVFDQCRDLGLAISSGGTRLEQARVIGRPEVDQFAVAANTATFGADDPGADQVAALWAAAAATRKQLLASVGRWRRLVARFNVRSLLPERLASAELPKLDLQRPHWLDPMGRRVASSQADAGRVP